MFSCIASLVSSCLNSAPVISDDESSSSTSADPLLWCRDLERHSCGEVSFAVVQANDIIEDHSQVEIGTGALFVGVYDGHGGSEASSFIKEHLFHHLMSESFEFLWMFLVSKTEWNSVCFLDAFLLAFSSICIAEDNGTITSEILRNAVSATEDDFMAHVDTSFITNPLIAKVGSCCLAGVIWKGTLHIANVGDSRAVIASTGRCNKIKAEQLSIEHNASRQDIREELRALHPQDPHIVVVNRGSWRVKGIIQ
ncbi:probable protein phosphatase 2C 68, partial [Cajanus cajan]|uniref:probable protein phosphatase 2C 68 n=1 Tax=Cajanus cajan TaxID=3821 RepID=UPI0010FB8446